MRAYLIDPQLETITEIDVEDYYGGEVEALIGCDDSVPADFAYGGCVLDGLDLVLVSEDELALEDGADCCFDADRGLMATRPIAGRAVVCGTTADGDFDHVAISLENLTRRVTFSRAEAVPCEILAAFKKSKQS